MPVLLDPNMAAHGGGVIVNNSSSAGLTAAQAGAAYGATKHGVIGLTKTALLVDSGIFL